MSINISDLMAAPPVTEDTLKKISMLAQAAKKGEEEISKLTDKLKSYQARLEEILSREIPEAMMQAGMSEFTLTDGSKIKIQKITTASIPSQYKDQAFAWLEENDHGDLIKQEISLKFNREQNEAAQEVFNDLFEKGFQPVQAKSVHFQTLSAFVREQIAAAVPIPMELLGVYQGQKAKIEEPRTKKPKN